MQIRAYQVTDYREIADLFHDSVHAISAEIYTTAQLEAWSPTPVDSDYWRTRLDRTRPYVAVQNEDIAGFIELEDDGHIDCLYVHPKFQRRGVASALLDHVSGIAQKREIQRLYLEASEVARPFFELRGFKLEKTNHVSRNQQQLVNYSMSRKL
jgi:putative acetyltransferase